MKYIYLFIFLISCSLAAFSQKSLPTTTSSTIAKKYVIKISPTVKFNFISPKKTSNYALPFSTMSTGFNANFLMTNKKNDYHDIGTSIEVIPVTIKQPQRIATATGYKIGFEYSYRFVFVVKNKPAVSFFTAVGTQANYSKIQSSTINLSGKPTIYNLKSLEQNVVFTPGIQYCKKSFFLDLSLPVGIGYNYTKQLSKPNTPVLPENDTNQKFHLMQWNAGCKLGVGAKF